MINIILNACRKKLIQITFRSILFTSFLFKLDLELILQP